MAFFAEELQHALGVVSPVVFLLVDQLVETGFDDADLFEVGGIEAQLVVIALAGRAVGTQGDRGGEHVTAVVVGVLADQIDAARGEECGIRLCAKDFLEFNVQFGSVHEKLLRF